jgi:hypothetical protein
LIFITQNGGLDMKLFNTQKWKSWLGMSFLALLAITTPLAAGVTSEAKKKLNDYFQEFPWIGLVADKLNYGPITIRDVNIHDGDKLALVAPGEKLNGTLKYKINSKHLEALHRYHLVIGIKEEGAQDCVTHNLGLWSSKGTGKFTLKAPKKAGVYQVRILFTEGLTCEGAREAWNTEKGQPSAAATIGVIIVE